jgi:hypothetical protein
MRRISLVLVGLSWGAFGCSSSNGQAPPAASPDSATLLSPTSVVQATVDGSRIFGAQVELARDQNGLRGRGPLGVVDLRTANGSIRGVVGGGPTELYLEPEGDNGFSLRGIFSGALGDLEVKPDRIQGQLGRCQYNLRRHVADEGTAYNGQRVCGHRYMESATFTLSPGIAALEPIDRAALIAVMLGR